MHGCVFMGCWFGKKGDARSGGAYGGQQVHIQGQSRTGPVVFCWEEGEPNVCFGHAIGEEDDARRPLKLKSA